MKTRLLLFLGTVVMAGCGRKADVIDWNRMKHQLKALAYDDSPYLPKGRVNQIPPAHTVATDAPLDVRRPPITLALVERGRDRFQIHCAACHGNDGAADTPVARYMSLRKPPSLSDPRIVGFSDDQIVTIISDGYGLMPSYAAQLPIEDRWAVTSYVRALQLSRAVALDALPAPLRSEAAAATHLPEAP
jgi:mono/diheme cytochrome c family protein